MKFEDKQSRVLCCKLVCLQTNLVRYVNLCPRIAMTDVSHDDVTLMVSL